MSPVLYGVPYVPPAPPLDPWRGVTQRWEAPDGTVWTISGPNAGGVRLMPGVRGLTEPPRELFYDETAGTAGGRWRGHRDLVRDVYWPLGVWQDADSAAWLDYDAAWWRSLDPDATGRWVVERPFDPERPPPDPVRHLLCRLADDGAPAWEFNPGMQEWVPYGVRLVAVDPYWRGAPVVLPPWSGAEGGAVPFIPEGGGPPVTISGGATTADAQVTNPGDVEAHPVWWVTDVTSVDLTIGAGVIEVPAVAEGKLLVIDSQPTEKSATEIDAPPVGLTAAQLDEWVAARLPTGVDRDLGYGTTWGSIPARATTSVGIDMVGTGAVQLRFTPRYRRAW